MGRLVKLFPQGSPFSAVSIKQLDWRAFAAFSADQKFQTTLTTYCTSPSRHSRSPAKETSLPGKQKSSRVSKPQSTGRLLLPAKVCTANRRVQSAVGGGPSNKSSSLKRPQRSRQLKEYLQRETVCKKILSTTASSHIFGRPAQWFQCPLSPCHRT